MNLPIGRNGIAFRPKWNNTSAERDTAGRRFYAKSLIKSQMTSFFVTSYCLLFFIRHLLLVFSSKQPAIIR